MFKQIRIKKNRNGVTVSIENMNKDGHFRIYVDIGLKIKEPIVLNFKSISPTGTLFNVKHNMAMYETSIMTTYALISGMSKKVLDALHEILSRLDKVTSVVITDSIYIELYYYIQKCISKCDALNGNHVFDNKEYDGYDASIVIK